MRFEVSKEDLSKFIEELQEIIIKLNKVKTSLLELKNSTDNFTPQELKKYDELDMEMWKKCKFVRWEIAAKIREISNQISTDIKIYPLVDRSDIVEPEYEQLLSQVEELIQNVENIEKEYDNIKSSMSEMIEQKKQEFHTKEQQKKLAEVKSKIDELLKTSESSEEAVWMTYKECWNDWRVDKQRTGPVSRKIKKMVDMGLYLDKDDEDRIICGIHDYDSITRKTTFKEYSECTLAEKQEIRKYQLKAKEIAESENEEYDIPGKVRIKILRRDIDKEYIEIEVTQRQLASAGILPEDLE